MMIRSNGTVELDGVAVGEFFGDGYMVNEKGVELGITTEMIRESAQNWIPANDGTETPVLTRTGRRILYCWQPATGKHRYLDMGTDLFLTDDEMLAYLGGLL